MKKMLFLVFLIMSSLIFAEDKSNYLGQEPPGTKEKVFFPGVISAGLYERDIAINNEGTEIYYSLMVRGISVIMVTRLVDGNWTESEAASFSANLSYKFAEPAFSPDGKKIYFLSTAPRKGEEPKPGWGHQHIWIADRLENGGWSEPYEIGAPVTSDDGQFFPSFTKTGTLYYTYSPSSDPLKPKLYRSKYINGAFQEPEELPAPVNGSGSIYNAAISPDESYLLACVQGRDFNKDPKIPEYFVFFRNDDDTWSEPVNLSNIIDKEGSGAISISVSSDGKYIFFSSDRGDFASKLEGKRLTSSTITAVFNSYGNGYSDIYWISTDILKNLKK
ncbi:MAG: PD40 domain-containing protein [Acidobacteria bacterium]|nr:PD40 domain-containing protein [Acidobacteriota bacterium]